MMDEFVRHLQTLSKVDSLIARIWLNVMARRFALLVFASLIAVFGLGMADLAGFYQLQASLGPVWAAAIVAVIDFVIAALLALAARSVKTGAEMDAALEVRSMAIKGLQENASELEAMVKALADQIRDAKDTIAGFVSNPLDAAAQKLLLPAILAIVKSVRSRRGKSGQAEQSRL